MFNGNWEPMLSCFRGLGIKTRSYLNDNHPSLYCDEEFNPIEKT
jgi:hypothetical protein